jgi:putative heme-binding domain-containing protein
MLELLKTDSPKRFARLSEALRDEDPFIRSAAVTSLARPTFRDQVVEALSDNNPRVRLGALLALRRAQYTNAVAILESALRDPDHDIRLTAVIWAGEEKIDELRPALFRALTAGNASPALVRAHAAAIERLGKPSEASLKAITQLTIFPLTNYQTKLSPFPDFAPRTKDSSSPRPTSDADWRKALGQAGDVESGRRLFFDPTVGCAQCHRVADYGGALGPDLSVIGRVANRDRIIDSILDPSKEIAPQFVQHTVETKNGESFAGILTGQQSDGTVTLLMNEGRGVVIPGSQVATHENSKVSLMPDELEQGLTLQEFRDLLAFLLSLK